MDDPKVKALAAGVWKWVGAVAEGGAITIGGVNPWQHKWELLGIQVELEEPAYHQRENATVWRINVDVKDVYFAATEITPRCVWFLASSDLTPLNETLPIAGTAGQASSGTRARSAAATQSLATSCVMLRKTQAPK